MSNAMTPASIDTDHALAEECVAASMRENRDAIVTGLSSWARMPFIAVQPEHATDMERSAHRPASHCPSSDESIDADVLLPGARAISHLWTELGRLPCRDGGDS